MKQIKRNGKIVRQVQPVSMMDEIVDELSGVLGRADVHRAHNSDQGEPRYFIDSGVPELNYVLDRKGRGWPVGRMVEIYGGNATMKTGLGYALINQVIKRGGDAILYPSEGNYDEWLALKYGIDLKKLVIADNETVEGVFTSFNRTMRKIGLRGLCVGMVDSVAGMSTKDEIAALENGEPMKRDRAAQVRALMISAALRKIGSTIPRTNSILFLVNQIRDDPDSPYGGSKPPGGKAIGFYASIRLSLKVMQKYRRTRKGKQYVAGVLLKITAEKNRLATPFQEAQILLDFERGLLPKPKKKKKK